jgi:hypothetical protein
LQSQYLDLIYRAARWLFRGFKSQHNIRGGW